MSLRRSLPAVVPLLAFLALPTMGHAASVADELSDHVRR